MDVKEIITHLSNFQNTWKGWNLVIENLTKFFGDTPTEKIKDYFSADNEAFKQLSSVFGK